MTIYHTMVKWGTLGSLQDAAGQILPQLASCQLQTQEKCTAFILDFTSSTNSDKCTETTNSVIPVDAKPGMNLIIWNKSEPNSYLSSTELLPWQLSPPVQSVYTEESPSGQKKSEIPSEWTRKISQSKSTEEKTLTSGLRSEMSMVFLTLSWTVSSETLILCSSMAWMT